MPENLSLRLRMIAERIYTVKPFHAMNVKIRKILGIKKRRTAADIYSSIEK